MGAYINLSNRNFKEDMRADFKNLKECHGEEEFKLLCIGLIGRIETTFRNQSETNYSSLGDTTTGRMFQKWNGPFQEIVLYE